MADINALIANQRPPDILGQFSRGLGVGQQLKAGNLANQAADQKIQQQSKINQLLQQQAGDFAGQAPAVDTQAGGQPDFRSMLTDTDKQSAQLLVANNDVEGLVKLKQDVLARGQKQGEENFKRETTLRKEFDKSSGEFVKVRDAHTRLLKASEDPSAAGDLALIFNYMKVLDPGSTVREGEFATAQNAAGMDQRIRSMYNQVVDGTRLTVPQRTDFVDRSGRLFQGQADNQQQNVDRFRGIAKRSGANPDNVVFEFTLPSGDTVVKATESITEDDMRGMSIEDLEELAGGLQ